MSAKSKKSKMKILIVCKSIPIRSQGGIQTHVWKLSEHMIRLGHKVSILTAGSWRQGIKTYDLEGRTIIEIPYLPLYRQPLMPMFLEELSFNISAKNWLKNHQMAFDIVHLQGRSGFMHPNSSNKKPIVSTFHGLVSIENNRSKRANSIEIFLHERWATWFERKQIKYSNALVAVSNEMLEEMQGLTSDNLAKTQIISNGVDLEKFNFNKIQSEIDEKRLVFVGRIDSIKGIYNLVQAMKQVKPEIHLVMIGDSFERKAFEKHVFTEGVADRIAFTGALPNTAVFDWIKASYALILPSFHETQGIVLLEANACGKPVLASDVGGIKEVVQHKENGFLFNPHNIDSIADAINALFEMPKTASQMGERGRELVEKYYTWDKIAEQTLDFYAKTIKDFDATKRKNAQKPTPITETRSLETQY
jgi:glycosyltransferase involved in cell wall biosynthesis